MNGELGKSISLIPIENDDNFYNIYHDNTPSIRKINSLLKRSYDFNKITNIFPEQNKIEDNSTKYRKLQLPKLNLKLNRNYKLPSLRIPHSGIFKEKLIKRENINTKKKSLTINNIVFDENQSFKYNSIDRIQSMKKFIKLNKKNIINRNIIKNKYEKDLMEFKIYSHNMNEMIADQIVIEFFKRINKTQNLNFNDLLLNYIKSCDGENNIPEETLVINNDFNISKDENKEKDEKNEHNLIIHNVFFEWIINKVIQNYSNYIKKTKRKISAKSIKNIIINEVKNLSKLFFHKKYEKIKMILNIDHMNSKIDDNNNFQEEEYSENNNIEIKKRKIKRELIDNIIEKTLKKNRNSIKQSDIINNNLKSFTNKNKRNSDVKINLKRNSNFNNDMKIIVDDIPNLIIRNENNSELNYYQKNNNNLTLENLNMPAKNKKKSIQLISVETNTDSTLIEKYKPLMDIKEENNDLQNQLYQPYYIYEGIDLQSEEKEKIISKNRKSIISSKFSERNKNQKNSNDLESLMYEIKTKNNMEYNKNYNSDNKINKNNNSKNENKDNYEKIEENNLDSDIKENTTKIRNNDLESNIKDNNKKYEKNNIESYNKENITKTEKSNNISNFNEYKKINNVKTNLMENENKRENEKNNKNLRQRNKNKSINNKSGERENSNQIKIEKENIKENKKTIRNKIINNKVKNLKDNSKSKYKRKDIQRKSNTKINNNNDKQEDSRKNLEDEDDERENEIEELNNEEEEDEDEEKEEENEEEEEEEEEENEGEENEEEENEVEKKEEEINKQKILLKKKKKSKKISMIKKNMENEIEKEKEKSYTGNKTDMKKKKKKTNKKENKIVPKKSIANQNIKINSELQGDEKEIETKIENKDIEDNQNENINKESSIEGFDNSKIENDINTEYKSEELNKKENLIVKDEKNNEIDIIKEEKYNLGKEDIEEIKEVAEPEIIKKKKRRKKKIKKESSNQKNLNNQNNENKNIIKEKEINNDKLIDEKEKEEIEEEEESEYYEDEEESEKGDYYQKDISLNNIKKFESSEDKILKEQEEKKEKGNKEKNYIRNNKIKKKTRLSQRKSTVVKLFKKKSIFNNPLNNIDRRSSRRSFTTKDIQHILEAITIPSQILEKEKIQENDYELNKSEERRNRGRKRIKHRKTKKKIKLLKLTDTSQSAFERFKKEQEMKKQLKLEEERKEREKLKKYFVDLKALKQLNDEGFDNYIRGKFDTLKYIKDSNDTKLRKEHFIFNIMKDFELLKKRKQKFNFVSPIKFFNQ